MASTNSLPPKLEAVLVRLIKSGKLNKTQTCYSGISSDLKTYHYQTAGHCPSFSGVLAANVVSLF